MEQTQTLLTNLKYTKHYTFGLIKPSVFKKGFIILNDIIKGDIGEILVVKKFKFNDHLAREFYASLSDKGFFEQLIKNMTQGYCYGFVIQGESSDIITKYRNLLGHTDPLQAESHTLRKKYGLNIDHNGTHGSDSIESAIRETQLIFPELFI